MKWVLGISNFLELHRSTYMKGGLVAQSVESACNVGESGLIPQSGRSPGGGNGNPTPVFLPGEFHGQRSFVGYSP